MLKGMWLKEAGFDVGDYISVTWEDGKIVNAPDAERAALKAAEAEFMDREMKALQPESRIKGTKNQRIPDAKAQKVLIYSTFLLTFDLAPIII